MPILASHSNWRTSLISIMPTMLALISSTCFWVPPILIAPIWLWLMDSIAPIVYVLLLLLWWWTRNFRWSVWILRFRFDGMLLRMFISPCSNSILRWTRCFMQILLMTSLLTWLFISSILPKRGPIPIHNMWFSILWLPWVVLLLLLLFVWLFDAVVYKRIDKCIYVIVYRWYF